MSRSHFAYIHRFGSIFRVTVNGTRQRAKDYFANLKDARNVTFIVEDRELLGEMSNSDLPIQTRMILKGLMALAGSYTGGVVNTAAGYLEAECNGILSAHTSRTADLFDLAVTSPEQAVRQFGEVHSSHRHWKIEGLMRDASSCLFDNRQFLTKLWIHHLAACVMSLEDIVNIRSEQALVAAGAVEMKISSDPQTFPASQLHLKKREEAHYLTLLTPRRTKAEKEYELRNPRMPVIETFQGSMAYRPRTKVKKSMLVLEIDLSFGARVHVGNENLRESRVHETLIRGLPLDVMDASFSQ